MISWLSHRAMVVMSEDCEEVKALSRVLWHARGCWWWCYPGVLPGGSSGAAFDDSL